MSRMYAMQRANGDWFAVQARGRLHVPVFDSRDAAMQARAQNFEMLLFTPVEIDERALKDLAPAEREGAAGFWLISNPAINLQRGQSVEYAQWAEIICHASAQTPE